ncbi:bestrophin-like domain [Alteraurantiacibacter palmitatis]|uniref:DUF4239 domain-containing protein n=1 Tax=Alteraurantiacibacter palmitatis TaxID=2054628 RepID=A0ABV7E2R9_9SPHN
MLFAGSPLWLDFILLLAIAVAAYESGRLLGVRLLGRAAGEADEAEDAADGHALSGVFGLLALLLAFSFGMALNRYEERRELVVAEANALSTFASRVELLAAEDRTPVRELLAQYGRSRLAFGGATNEADANAAYAEAARMHARIGDLVYASLARTPPDPRGPLLIQPFNEAGDIAAERLAAREARLPEAVLLLLCIFAICGAGLLGYNRAASQRTHRPAALLFLTLLAVAFVTVLDLDRPRSGSILVPQQAMERQVAELVS